MSMRPAGDPTTLAHRRLVSLAIAACALAAAIVFAGCAVGSSFAPSQLRLTITRDFGARTISELPMPSLRGSHTALALLEQNASVRAGAGGQVESIDGYGASQTRRRPVAWFHYVNGITAPNPGATTVNTGDQVWSDLHDASAATPVRAVVGSFPEPFLHGVNGRRLPVVVECSDPSQPSCAMVSQGLSSIGIPAARGGFLLAAGGEELRVLVGAWPVLRHDPAANQIERGPQTSGVFARIDASGHAVTVLDEHGNAVRTLGAGSGLVAATRFRKDQPIWVVTGTDAKGVAAAARAFEPGALHGRFALAVSGDVGIPLPQPSR